MKARYIAIIVVITAVIVYYIGTAFLLQPQAINKQSFYIRLQSDWNSHPGNIIYEVTNMWTKSDDLAPLDPQTRLDLSKEANVDHVMSVHNKSYIMVHHGNTNCHDLWEPHYARFGADTIRHQIEYLMGVQKSPDPNRNQYTLLKGKQSDEVHAMQIKSGYSQFIPICTQRELTSFDYSVKINDESVGFDVYFVPSIEEQKNFDEDSGLFRHYTNGQCDGKNYVRFSGTCNDVDSNAGLLIAVPDSLSLPLTKIEVWLYEK